MKKIYAFVFLLIFSGATHADKNNGSLFLKYCSYSLKSPESLTETEFGGVMFCYGLLHGMDGMQQVEKIKGVPQLYCPPPGHGVEQGARVAVKYLEEHPEDLHHSGSGLIIKALVNAFPCQK